MILSIPASAEITLVFLSHGHTEEIMTLALATPGWESVHCSRCEIS